MMCAESGRYLELATGQSWTYEVNDTVNHTMELETTTVGAMEPVSVHPGIVAFKLTTTKSNGTDDSWQEDTGTEIRRHLDDDNAGATHSTSQYDPYRIRLDETPAHLVAGATYTSSYTELKSVNGAPATSTTKDETWMVTAVDEVVDVQAGSFCTLHLHRTTMENGVPTSTKDYFFSRTVGKIKEIGDAHTEELTARSP